jgi:hypothetical protein
MTTARQAQQIQLLMPILNSLASFEVEKVIEKIKVNFGAQLSLESLTPLMLQMRSSAVELQGANFDNVPYAFIAQLVNSYTNIQSVFVRIAGYNPLTQQSSNARTEFEYSLEDGWNAAFPVYRTVMLSRGESQAQLEIEKLNNMVRNASSAANETAEAVKAKQTEIERELTNFLEKKSNEFERQGGEKLVQINQALDEVRKAAGEAGVSQTAVHFKNEAEEHLSTAKIWLTVLITITIVLFLFSIFGSQVLSVTGTPEPSSGADYFMQVGYLAKKALIVFCLIFALIWAARNYGAARHNYVVNKHRNNALGSFQAFVASTSDESTKNAVLIQATQSIFSPQPSGFIKTDGENSVNSPIIEVIRAVKSGGKDD